MPVHFGMTFPPKKNALTSNTKPSFRQLSAETTAIKNLLWQAPLEDAIQSNTIIDLPLPDGSSVNVKVFESPILSPTIAKQFPQLRTFTVIGAEDNSISGRIDFTTMGFHAMLRIADDVIYINPEAKYTAKASATLYRSASRKNETPHAPFVCGNKEKDSFFSQRPSEAKNFSSRPFAAKNFGSTLRTYRLALSATKEYSDSVAAGNLTNTFAEMVTAINRVNEIYQKEVGIKLQLVSGTNLISRNKNDFTSSDLETVIAENQMWVDTKLGAANYDIGHIFNTPILKPDSPYYTAGLANLGVVCDIFHSDKAMGGSSSLDLLIDDFYVTIVAHEIGHQFGANHTFNADGSTAGGCEGNRNNSVGNFFRDSAYEVGGGSTIMSYASCADQNLQASNSPYFHARSIQQIRQYVDGDIASTYYWQDGSICGAPSNTGDTAPVANAGNDYTIPANTPFILTGAATDSNSATSTFTYTWEEFDLGNATISRSDMHTDHGYGPLVRSRQGTTDAKRYIPTLDAVLAGNFALNKGERLPTTDRTMNFMLTVRSGTYGIAQDAMKITVDKDAGPFKITQPTSSIFASGGESKTVKWNVANTNIAPVNCGFVDISYSTNGGKSFTTSLLKSAVNNGSATVKLPNIATSKGRVKVQCTNNIFYAISLP